MTNNSAIQADSLQQNSSRIKPVLANLRPLLFFLILSFAFSLKLFADDPGIAKVRLIQQSDTSYIFEVDIPQTFLGSFKEPILP